MHHNKYSLDAYCISLELLCKKGKEWPNWSHSLPCCIISDTCLDSEHRQILVEFDIHDRETNLTITNLNKSLTDVDQTLKIQNIWVNNIKIDLDQISDAFTFHPNYSIKDLVLAKSNKLELPEIIHNSDNTLYYNGQWVFAFQQPFFLWYRNKLNSYLDQAEENYKVDFLGQVSLQEMQRLEFLLNEFAK